MPAARNVKEAFDSLKGDWKEADQSLLVAQASLNFLPASFGTISWKYGGTLGAE